MKRLLQLLLILLTVSISRDLRASHMMGGDMSYRCLGGGKYKITAKIYRDCRGISFNGPSFGVYAGLRVHPKTQVTLEKVSKNILTR